MDLIKPNVLFIYRENSIFIKLRLIKSTLQIEHATHRLTPWLARYYNKQGDLC